MHTRIWLLLMIALFIALPTVQAQEGDAPTIPWPTEGWQSSAPEDEGMDGGDLDDMLAYIEDEDLDIDNIAIVRHGYLVFEHAFPPFSPTTRHHVYSVTKSFTSTLIGIAVAEGHISGLDAPVLDFFPRREFENMDADKAALTVGDLLTMTAGIEWSEGGTSYQTTLNSAIELAIQPDDWVGFILNRPMVATPGTQYHYSSGASHLLSAILQEATGMTALAYADEVLFGPLDITNITWDTDPDGINIGGWGLRINPRDMAKFGFLYLHEGEWDGQQIVPAEWVAAATRDQTGTGYGYQWWIDGPDYYHAEGLYGQFIIVWPELDLVVVFTSDLEESQWETALILLETYIVGAVME